MTVYIIGYLMLLFTCYRSSKQRKDLPESLIEESLPVTGCSSFHVLGIGRAYGGRSTWEVGKAWRKKGVVEGKVFLRAL